MTPEARAVVVDALRAQAAIRQRAATRAAGELAADRASGEVKDVRPAAVRIANVLAEASDLTAFADRLAAGGELVVPGAVDRTVVADLVAPLAPAAAEPGPTPAAAVPVHLPEGTTGEDIAAALAELHAAGYVPATDEDATDADLAEVDAALGLADAAV